jgi:phage-related protein
MKDNHPMRPILWIASSLKDMKNMPEEVKKEFGHSLREVQKRRDPGNIKPLKHLGETGILEIIAYEKGGTFRTVYTVEFEDAIVVLHVFQKKSKSGIATTKQDIELVLKRLKPRIEYDEFKRKK